MKVRKVKIGIKDVETLLNEFADAAVSIEAGEKVKHERGVYFTNIQAFRKALTQKRLELLHAIKTEHPSSINHLARILQRDIKNVATDGVYGIAFSVEGRQGCADGQRLPPGRNDGPRCSLCNDPGEHHFVITIKSLFK